MQLNFSSVTLETCEFKMAMIKTVESVPRFASAVIWSRGPRLWRGFTHRFQTADNCPIGCDQTKTQAWRWNGEGGGHGTGPGRRLGV